MNNWFFNPFVGSNVPITHESLITVTDPFTGLEQKIIQKDIIGYIFTDDLQKFMMEMKKIQDEIKR